MMPSSQQNSELTPSTHNSRNNVALGMIGGAFAGVLAFTTPFVFMQLRSSLPYMATPRHKVERALKFIAQRTREQGAAYDKKLGVVNFNKMQQSHGNRTKLNFVDLGSGDGTTILTAASLGWKATGLELNPTLWVISSMRRLLSGNSIRSDSQLVMGDMFQSTKAREELQIANAVMVFGVQSLMPKIADLVQRECKTGCFLMSYRFRVPLLVTDDTSRPGACSKAKSAGDNESSGINASLIYDEDEMRIYELESGKPNTAQQSG